METQELKRSGTHVLETDSSNSSKEELIKRHEHDNGMVVIELAGKGVIITLGEHRLNKEMLGSVEEAMEKINNKDWDLLLATIGVLTQALSKLKEYEK